MVAQEPVTQTAVLSLPPVPKLSDLTREFWDKLLGGGLIQRGGDVDLNVGTKPWK